MTLQLPNSHTFHLTVLYSSSKQERENPAGQDRLSRNRMLSQQPSAPGEGGARAVTYQLQPALQQLCHTLNGFVFVVDASGSRESGERAVTGRPLCPLRRCGSLCCALPLSFVLCGCLCVCVYLSLSPSPLCLSLSLSLSLALSLSLFALSQHFSGFQSVVF